MNKVIKEDILPAILVALYAVNSPCSKLLLDFVPPMLMAGLLYLGAARTSAYYAIAPFIGTLLSLLIFREFPHFIFFVALGCMIVGTWFCFRDEPVFQKEKNG